MDGSPKTFFHSLSMPYIRDVSDSCQSWKMETLKVFSKPISSGGCPTRLTMDISWQDATTSHQWTHREGVHRCGSVCCKGQRKVNPLCLSFKIHVSTFFCGGVLGRLKMGQVLQAQYPQGTLPSFQGGDPNFFPLSSDLPFRSESSEIN